MPAPIKSLYDSIAVICINAARNR